MIDKIEPLPVSQMDDEIRWKAYYAIYRDPFLSRHAPGGGMLWGQYNRQLFPPDLILDVIRTHPMVIYCGTVCRNLYHVPPDEFLGVNQTAGEVERLLSNIREREQVEYALRQQRNELRDTEARFRLMVEGVKDCAIFSLDTGGRVTS